MSVQSPLLDAPMARTVPLRVGIRAGELANLVVCIAGYCILFCFVARSGPALVYDERYYFEPIALLHQYGLSLTFLREYPQGAGLLNNVLHWALAPITGLAAPAIRLVNPLFLLLTVYGTWRILKQGGCPTPGASALGLIGIPFIWILNGMALTEMPAILLSTLSFWCLLWGKSLRAARPCAAHLVAFLAGFLLGLAFLSRQPVIVLLAAVPLLFLGELRQSVRLFAAYFCGTAVLPVAICTYWQGLVAPHAPVHVGASGISVHHIVLSLSYAAVAMLILAPRWFAMPRLLLAFTVAGVLLANLSCGLIEINAARSVIERLPAQFVAVWPRVVGSGMLALAALFCISTLHRAIEQRHNPHWLFFCAGMLLLIATAGKIPHQFSSRYTAMSCVLMVLAAAPYSVATPAKSLRLAAGMAVGYLCLMSYFSGAS